MSSYRGEPQPVHPISRIQASTRDTLANHYLSIRKMSEALCQPLMLDDYGLQATAFVSPAKWHLAHTTWFFETFLLKEFVTSYRPFHPQFEFLFNSYYEQIGALFPRPQRGMISRPTTDEVFQYRAHVDIAMQDLLATVEETRWPEVTSRTTLGCHHEQQHQELILTDIKYNFSINPLKPAYRADLPVSPISESSPITWIEQPGGIQELGWNRQGFAFDNEAPRHRILLSSYALSSRVVTNGEYRHFIEDGGYIRPELWLSDGWQTVCVNAWRAPLYWSKHDEAWQVFSLSGMRPLNDAEPVCHVSFYEADAYARWAGKRLPNEAEWEVLAQSQKVEGNFRESGLLHPVPTEASHSPAQMFGDVWEWTSSPYSPYPGYRPSVGALGEYNGKFMANQFVLRGGSCVTPMDHIRPSYRNFFYPADRWQFSGFRLADDR